MFRPLQGKVEVLGEAPQAMKKAQGGPALKKPATQRLLRPAEIAGCAHEDTRGPDCASCDGPALRRRSPEGDLSRSPLLSRHAAEETGSQGRGPDELRLLRPLRELLQPFWIELTRCEPQLLQEPVPDRPGCQMEKVEEGLLGKRHVGEPARAEIDFLISPEEGRMQVAIHKFAETVPRWTTPSIVSKGRRAGRSFCRRE